MARITVEDCLKKIPNRFKLVVTASKRARDLEMGADDPMVPWENDKPTVVALREIANGSVDMGILNKREAEVNIDMLHARTDAAAGVDSQ